jgi:hypothetical protein
MPATWNHRRQIEASIAGGRQHPYFPGPGGGVGFQNFVENPALIREVLEDLRPFDGQPAIEVFYQLLEWVNGPQSILESVDCAFRYVADNGPMRAIGRVMLMYRKLDHNLLSGFTYALTQATVNALNDVPLDGIRHNFDLYQYPTEFLNALTDLPAEIERMGIGLRDGCVTSVDFQVFGENEAQVFENLELVFRGLAGAVREVDFLLAGLRPLSLSFQLDRA